MSMQSIKFTIAKTGLALGLCAGSVLVGGAAPANAAPRNACSDYLNEIKANIDRWSGQWIVSMDFLLLEDYGMADASFALHSSYTEQIFANVEAYNEAGC